MLFKLFEPSSLSSSNRQSILVQSELWKRSKMFEIPKVVAPMNFGIEFLNSTSHGNLKFLLDNDEELIANSAIMSFNSPVIKKMTIEDCRNTVDAQDFSKDVIQCFLVSAYTGKLNHISMSIFRELHKIAQVFEVQWLKDACYEYFQSVTTEAVAYDKYDYQLFVFNEAMYIFDKLKSKNYIDKVIKMFKSCASCTENFVTKYLSDVSNCPAKNLDVIMEMTKDEEDVLVKVLVSNLETEKPSLNQNSRRILEKLNSTACLSSQESLYQSLLERLEVIENPSTEDFRLIVRILRQSKHAPPAISKPRDNDAATSVSHNPQFNNCKHVPSICSSSKSSATPEMSYKTHQDIHCKASDTGSKSIKDFTELNLICQMYQQFSGKLVRQ